MSSTVMLGHWDVPGLSATKPRPRQWICIPTMPKDVGMLSLPVLVTAPYMSVRGDNTTPFSNDSIAQPGSMVQSWVRVPAGVDLMRTDHVQWGRPDSEEVIKQAEPTTLGALEP